MAADGSGGRPGEVDGEVHGGVDGGVDVAVADDRTSVRFWGSVDLAVRAAAAEGLGGLGGLRGTTPLAIDCRDVEFMDSTGLSVLVRLVRDAAADGRPVTFLGATTQVLDLLATTGVDQWMAELGVRAG